MIHTVAINLPISATKREELQSKTLKDPQMIIFKQFILNEGWPIQRKSAHPQVPPFWHVKNDLHIVEDYNERHPNRYSYQHAAAHPINHSLCSSRYWPGMSQ